MNLKPCPFCGGEAATEPSYSLGNPRHIAYCKSCFTRCEGRDKRHAITKWNTRATKWNPASKLPTPNEFVLVVVYGEAVPNVMKYRLVTDNWLDRGGGVWPKECISNWRELPELPDREEQ